MRVGIVGAGQLGRMLALAGYPLGIRSLFLDPNADSSGGQVGPVLVGNIDDASCMRELASQVDVVTFDIENVPVEALEAAASKNRICPPPIALGVAQDRLSEKQLFESIGVATAPYVVIADEDDLDAVGTQLGWPVVLKARRLGYDGRGQRIVRTAEELEPAWRDLGSVPSIAEAWIDFEREVSLIAVRGRDGSAAFYPLAENVHDNGILHSTSAPYVDEELQREAENCLDAILQRFDYCGVLTVEFFVADGRLVANEIAPRVHNSGHWTIEGAQTSQFENHMRAVIGLPLGSTSTVGHAYMVNLLGEIPNRKALLSIPGLHLHDYGKSPRPLRKLGHCTLVGTDKANVIEHASAISAIVSRS